MSIAVDMLHSVAICHIAVHMLHIVAMCHIAVDTVCYILLQNVILQ